MTDDIFPYVKLDEKIIKSITQFPGGNFLNIHAGAVAREAQKLDPKNADRVTFVRMRDLEKKGLIYQNKRQWYPGAKT